MRTRAEVDRIVRLYGSGLTTTQVGERVGMSAGGVGYLLRRLPDYDRLYLARKEVLRNGEPTRLMLTGGDKVADPARLARMAHAYRAGWTLEEVGGQEGISRERVRQLLTKFTDYAALRQCRRACNAAWRLHAKRLRQCRGCGLWALTDDGGWPSVGAQTLMCAFCRGYEWAFVIHQRSGKGNIERMCVDCGDRFRTRTCGVRCPPCAWVRSAKLSAKRQSKGLANHPDFEELFDQWRKRVGV